MPEVSISIGGRQFEVACQAGEEPYLEAAAKMLDDEAQVLSDHVGRMPEARMLLMAGLMLADKAASMEDQVAEVQAKLRERDAELDGLRNSAPSEPQTVEVIPESVTTTLTAVATQMEELAAQLEPAGEAPAQP